MAQLLDYMVITANIKMHFKLTFRAEIERRQPIKQSKNVCVCFFAWSPRPMLGFFALHSTWYADYVLVAVLLPTYNLLYSRTAQRNYVICDICTPG